MTITNALPVSIRPSEPRDSKSSQIGRFGAMLINDTFWQQQMRNWFQGVLLNKMIRNHWQFAVLMPS